MFLPKPPLPNDSSALLDDVRSQARKRESAPCCGPAPCPASHGVQRCGQQFPMDTL